MFMAASKEKLYPTWLQPCRYFTDNESIFVYDFIKFHKHKHKEYILFQ